MIPKDQETTRQISYRIPGLYELADYFDNNLSTGTVNFVKENESWAELYRRNITGSATQYPFKESLAFSQFLVPLQIRKFVSSWNNTVRDNISVDVSRLLSSIENTELVKEVNSILEAINLNIQYFDIQNIPEIKAFQLENGSIALEWILGHFRIGFNFDPKPGESGYYLISDSTAGEVRYLGNFNGLSKQNIIRSLLVLIFGK
ncbi:MAG: hypothetical protein C3F13_02850 [Anaerolineales bacterium]|nr:MAG: hypothetical protein C3F13_02850 [Anaerolineales bacterium]